MLFVKAYAVVAARYPQLRQIYLRWPWPHVYEHPFSVATVAISRRLADDDWLFFAVLERPEGKSLEVLQSAVTRYQSAPVEQAFACQLRLSRLPFLIRRAWWWVRLHLMPRRRVKRLGTFGVTTLAGQGATIVDPKAPLTSILSYGPLDSHGQCSVSVTYDHRLLDGFRVARFLADLEGEMCGRIADELTTVPRNRTGCAPTDHLSIFGSPSGGRRERPSDTPPLTNASTPRAA